MKEYYSRRAKKQDDSTAADKPPSKDTRDTSGQAENGDSKLVDDQ